MDDTNQFPPAFNTPYPSTFDVPMSDDDRQNAVYRVSPHASQNINLSREYRQVVPFQGGPERPGQRPPYTHVVSMTSLFPNDVFGHGPEDRTQVALTFDDGPDGTWTPQILYILRQYGIKATFMCVGQMVRAFPRVLESMIQQGHIVGNHTWNHPHLTRILPSQVRLELSQTEFEIERIARVRPHLFRPPYGQLDTNVVREVIDLNYKIILWNVDSLCWAGLSGPHIAANVLAHVKPGAIILMHCAGGNRSRTVAALPYIIEVLLAEGYTFSTVPELLNISPYD